MIKVYVPNDVIAFTSVEAHILYGFCGSNNKTIRDHAVTLAKAIVLGPLGSIVIHRLAYSMEKGRGQTIIPKFLRW